MVLSLIMLGDYSIDMKVRNSLKISTFSTSFSGRKFAKKGINNPNSLKVVE